MFKSLLPSLYSLYTYLLDVLEKDLAYCSFSANTELWNC